MSCQDAFIGSLVADAFAMPVHWYYDTTALDRDYGAITGYQAPRNPHPDSILRRSHYTPRNATGEILHDQAMFWGRRGIHYHQSLRAGENTLNLRLAAELHRFITTNGVYDPDAWLDHYIRLMQTPGWHRDTYLEECHRGFFDRLARGKKPRACGIDDIHIGGLSQVPALLAALETLGPIDEKARRECVATHVALTHRNRHVLHAADALTRILIEISSGQSVRAAIAEIAGDWCGPKKLHQWSRNPDRHVVGRILSPACYLPGAFSASLFFAWKYADDFDGGIIANAQAGGDSCHRGVVVGSILAADGRAIAPHWLHGLHAMKQLRSEPAFPS